MISYLTQLEILRADNRVLLGDMVALFSIDKCVKRVTYLIRDTKIDGIAKHEAHILYTNPESPTINLRLTNSLFGVNVITTVKSPIVVHLKEVGIVYSLTPNPTLQNTKYILPSVYGTTSTFVPFTVLDPTKIYYIKPYIISCVGVKYGTEKIKQLLGIGYDIIEETLIVY
jgi:hypothetical protein